MGSRAQGGRCLWLRGFKEALEGSFQHVAGCLDATRTSPEGSLTQGAL